MTTIAGVQTLDHKQINLEIDDAENRVIPAEHLTLFPALIDPHVHFRTPGLEDKEDWRTAAKASICGGYTTVFDMPNTIPPTNTAQLLSEKKALIDSQLQEVGIPLRYQLFFGADKAHLNEISKVKDHAIGIKIFMGCSTGNLVVDDDETLAAVFEIAAHQDMLVAVHAEDEHLMRERVKKFPLPCPYECHSQIRNEEVAARAVEKAIALVKKYGTRLYILHSSTEEEIGLIKKAKQEGLPVYAETTPHHLFLTTSDYQHLQGKAVMNPPLRENRHHRALFQAIHDNIIDTVGSDHAPHTISEKEQPYGACPSGVPGIETTLPLLLNAYHQDLLSLDEIISLTSSRARDIFRLPHNNDFVLVDLNKKAVVKEERLKTKCRWSPFAGMMLTGWPVYTVIHDQLFDLQAL